MTRHDWFAKRCFEVLPNRDEHCAWHCPTIPAVGRAEDITCCEEALLLFRQTGGGTARDRFEEKLLADARDLRALVAAHYD